MVGFVRRIGRKNGLDEKNSCGFKCVGFWIR